MNSFFIVGAPRSGTTMLRDLFKQIPELYSPEETHFFRWAAPCRGNEYNATYNNNKTLKLHRELDGVSDNKFEEIYNSSNSKSDLTNNYCQYVAELKNAKVWFEKSPQNIYGLPLIAAQMPEVKVINIIRHPYDVVKSLLVGKVIKVDDVVGAANYWNESIDIATVCKAFMTERLYDIKYEDLLDNPEFELEALKKYLKITSEISSSHLKSRDTIYTDILNRHELDIINKICDRNMNKFGYDKV